MRVMVLVKATEQSETGGPPDPEMMAAMGRFNAELREAGVLQMADGLQPTAAGARIAFDGSVRSETRGPFSPPTEQVAGFWIWEVKNMDEALDWVRRCPNPMPGPSLVEIRPFNVLG